MWFFSRFLVGVSMLGVAPFLPAPSGGVAATFSWDVFFSLDSIWYKQIATTGYEYVNDGGGHSVAFYPLFPLFSKLVMSLGLPFEVSGTLVNHLAFLGALIVLYVWVNEFHGVNAARWSTAVLAWCPLSVFCSVLYSEALYLLFSTAALRAFDKKQYGWFALWGAIASAGRPTAIALLSSFWLVVLTKRREIKAFIATFIAGTGLYLYSLYCQIQFGDALAFMHVQKAWRSSIGFNWADWWKMLMQITVGSTNYKNGYLKDPWHPLAFIIIISCGYLVWRFRHKLGAAKVDYSFAFLGFILWLLAGDPLTNTVMIFGGAYLLWRLRTQLSLITVVYGLCGISLLLISGSTISLNRLAYGIVSLAIALGLLLSRHPRWGYMVMAFFAILLTSFSVRFAQNLWVA